MQQNCRMHHQMAGLVLQSPFRTISVLVVHLLLADSCRGQSQLISKPQPIVAAVGDDILLPCHLEPALDIAAKTLEWTRPDLNPRFVHVWRAGQNLVSVKNPSYKGRTSLFTDEVKKGNISLKLSKVKRPDEGRYRCYIPEMNIDSFVELVVGSVSSPVVSLSGIDRGKGGVFLLCESSGWYPEPEVLWLDGEGNLLPAGPAETVRGPDDLYNVSSRVTVEKRHSNSFTCRVQQKIINQTRETHFHVPDDFFEVQSNPAVPIITALAVCILVILALVCFVWKRRQNIFKTKRSHCDETDEEELNPLKQLQEQQMKQLENEFEKKLAEVQQQLKDEKQQYDNNVCRLTTENQRMEDDLKTLESKNKEFEKKLAEVQQQLKDEKQQYDKDFCRLMTENQRMESDLKTLENKEVEEAQSSWSSFNWKTNNKQTLENEQQKRKEAEKQVQILQLELKDKNMELSPLREQLNDEQQRRENAEKRVKTLEEELQTKNNEFKMDHPNTTHRSKLKLTRRSFKQHFKEQQQKKEQQQGEEQQRRDGAGKEVQTKKSEANSRVRKILNV